MTTNSIQEITFTSEALNETMHLLIFLPENYTPMMRYPVVIAADGKDYFQLGRVHRAMETLIEDGDVEETIIVGIPYKNVLDRRRKYLLTGDLHTQYLTFLIEELLPYLENEFSIDDDRTMRTLIGDSQAGTISLITALKYPHHFGNVIMHSPQVDDGIFELVQNTAKPATFNVYHAIGLKETDVITKDKTVKDFLTPNRQLHALMEDLGFRTFYKELDGHHTWKTWQPDLKNALYQILK